MVLSHMTQIGTAALLLGAAVLSSGCSSDDGGPSLSTLTIAPTENDNGDSQAGTVGDPLDVPLRVIVTRDDQPVPDVDVQWLTTSGGSFEPATSVTGSDGIASTAWTLGATSGSQTATARVPGAEGSPVTFPALATDPPGGGGGGGGGGGPQPARRAIIR